MSLPAPDASRPLSSKLKKETLFWGPRYRTSLISGFYGYWTPPLSRHLGSKPALEDLMLIEDSALLLSLPPQTEVFLCLYLMSASCDDPLPPTRSTSASLFLTT